MVACRNGAVVGFLVGAPRDEESWGKNVWIELAGHAVERAEDVRDLYAAAAGRWVDEGRTRHYALVPATDSELVDAWFRLGFGQQQAHGAREVPAQTAVLVPEGFEIGEPNPAEIEALIDVDLARGSGIGVALTEACFARAREHGYATIVTDWRVTNLLASRFWSKRGFRTTFLRLYRSIP